MRLAMLSCVVALLAVPAGGAGPAGGSVPHVEGVYVGAGTLVQPCELPGGAVTYTDTIVSVVATVRQSGDQVTVVGPYVARRDDGSEYGGALSLNLTLAPDATVSGEADFMFDETTSVHLEVTGAFVGDMLDLVQEARITYLPDNGFCDQTIAVSMRYDRHSTTAELSWTEPEGDGLAPPRDLTVRLLNDGQAEGGARARRAPVTGYRVYRSSQPNVATTPENFFTSVPPTETSVTADVPPGGSFFVVTATYAEGESGPSNEAGAGTPGATLTRVTIKGTKIVAKGAGFTDAVEVYVDGYRFAAPATVKANKKVVQKGRLVTGETILEYITPGRPVVVSFVNSDATVSRMLVVR